jgi:hypothetical protein
MESYHPECFAPIRSMVNFEVYCIPRWKTHRRDRLFPLTRELRVPPN